MHNIQSRSAPYQIVKTVNKFGKFIASFDPNIDCRAARKMITAPLLCQLLRPKILDLFTE